jgi:hypothetical protein
LVVLPTHLTNEFTKKSFAAKTPTNRVLRGPHKLPLAVETWKLALATLGKHNQLTLETTNNKCASMPFVRFPR